MEAASAYSGLKRTHSDAALLVERVVLDGQVSMHCPGPRKAAVLKMGAEDGAGVRTIRPRQ